jgi:hypothetical protein
MKFLCLNILVSSYGAGCGKQDNTNAGKPG